MGTNYYLHDLTQEQPPCPHCGRPYESAGPLHIGKSSAGWCFALHVIPERGINTLDDWRREWGKPQRQIRDEYDRAVTLADMEDVICNRDWEPRKDRAPHGGYKSWDEFYRLNHAEPGPNNRCGVIVTA